MSLWEQMKKWVDRDSAHRTVVSVPAGHTDTPDVAAPATAGASYFRLWLVEMMLRKDREWFSDWSPAVQSLVRFRFGDQQLDVANVAGPLALKDVSAANLDRVVHLNHRLTGLLPFNGGDVEIMAALVAMKGGNSAERFLKVVGDFATLLAVPQLSSAIAIAAPLAAGVQELIGATDGELHLGLHQTLVGAGGGGSNTLASGYVAIAAAPAAALPAERLWVKQDRLCVGHSLAASAPLDGHTYMLLRVETRAERDDWDALIAISVPFQQAMTELGNGEVDRAELACRQAQGVALRSPDLSRADRVRVARTVREQFDEAKRAIGLGAVKADELTLGAAMQSATLSVQQWIDYGRPAYRPDFSADA
jgi:hypothetical protein